MSILAIAPILFFIILILFQVFTPNEYSMGVVMLSALAFIAFCVIYASFSIIYTFINIHKIRKHHIPLPTKTLVLIRITLFFALGIAVYYPVYYVISRSIPHEATPLSFLISAILSVAAVFFTTRNLRKNKYGVIH